MEYFDLTQKTNGVQGSMQIISYSYIDSLGVFITVSYPFRNSKMLNCNQ